AERVVTAEPVVTAERVGTAEPAAPPARVRAVPEAPVLIAGLVACAVLGLWAGPLQPLLDAAATAAGAR
ncbi:MAG: hypothetical protein AB7G09_25960, partial [Pseudonocardia sp.]